MTVNGGWLSDYLDARHKIQEHIKVLIAETSDGVIGLTRETSADPYKVASVIVGAVVGALSDSVLVYGRF